MYGEPIKIQLGQIFMNRTRKYLFPVLKRYGPVFASKINTLSKVAVGIGDIVVDKCGIHHEKHLFLLVDTLYNTSQFVSILDDLRRHPSYEDDYVYGNILKSRFHMIVIQVPESYLNAFTQFKNSKFSQMYSEKDLKQLFLFDAQNVTDEYRTIQKVLIKDHNYRFEFANIIKKEFLIPEGFSEEDVDDSFELDLSILEREEMFNANKPEIKTEEENDGKTII